MLQNLKLLFNFFSSCVIIDNENKYVGVGSMFKELLLQKGVPELKTSEEMLKVLLTEEYGFLPPKPNKISFNITNNFIQNFCAGKADCKKVVINCEIGDSTFSFPCYCTIPNKEGKYPFFVHINFRPDVPDRYQPTEELIDNGFAVLSFCYNDVTSDNNDFTNGLASVLYPEGRKKPTDAGKIAMWAWASHRVLDFAETLPQKLDMNHACVCGHSRLGKTALLAGATDTRFKYVYSNDSGCSGAAITRGKRGEDVEAICRKFPYWFCENYYKYVKNEDKLPFDQHYLIAAIAPRFVMVGSAAEDIWADPEMEMLACFAASDAFKEGFISEDRLPKIDDIFIDGNPGYHLRDGKHYFSRLDWQRFIQFIRKHY